MKHRLLRTSTIVLILGLGVLWLTAPSDGGRGGHTVVVHASPNVGSVHYGARPVAPVRVVPGVGGVHYVAPGGAYRNPYRAEYFGRFRPGYFPIVIGGAQFYGYYSLPVGCGPVVINGITYYFCGGIYYQPYIYNGQTVYMVAPM